MTYLFKIAAPLVLVSLLLASCNKTESFNPDPELTVEKRIHPLWYLGSAIIIVIELTEGQRGATTTTTNVDGSSVTVTGPCTGLGSCAAAMSHGGSDIGGGDDEDNDWVGDYIIEDAQIGVTLENEIILLVDENNPHVNDIFYSDNIAFLSDNYTVDNQNFLDELGLVEPFEIVAGDYQVMQIENYKYIVIGNAN